MAASPVPTANPDLPAQLKAFEERVGKPGVTAVVLHFIFAADMPGQPIEEIVTGAPKAITDDELVLQPGGFESNLKMRYIERTSVLDIRFTEEVNVTTDTIRKMIGDMSDRQPHSDAG